MNKLNLGCGLDYKEGWVNLDFDDTVKVDVLADFDKQLPFDNDTFDYIYANYVLEHSDNIFFLLSELDRILKTNGVLEIIVPHYTSTNCFKVFGHKYYFGIGSLNLDYYYSLELKEFKPLSLKVTKERLLLFQRRCTQNKTIEFIFNLLNNLNFLFNLGHGYQVFMERFFIFGFDEIKYTMVKIN